MKGDFKTAIMLGAFLGFSRYGGFSSCEHGELSIEGGITIPQHGEPNSRPEHIKKHKKLIKIKSRSRKKKRGY